MVEIAKASALLFGPDPRRADGLADRSRAEHLFAMAVGAGESRGVGIVYVARRQADPPSRQSRHRPARRQTHGDAGCRRGRRRAACSFMTGRVVGESSPRSSIGRRDRSSKLLGSPRDGLFGQRFVACGPCRRGRRSPAWSGAASAVVGRRLLGFERIAYGHVQFDGRMLTGRSAREMLDLGAFSVPPDQAQGRNSL